MNNEPDLQGYHATVITQKEYAEGEVAYRRRQAKVPLSWRELILLTAGGAVALYFAANVLWAWLT